ncbi:MAG: (2Fe-2S)-binding protein [bacterium]|nr:(2Fe-2S)-binding protein [bacterium]
MDLVKLEIDGKRVIADNRQTILEVARQHGVDSIPTLCHDGQLEPFASCFLCVVKVKGRAPCCPPVRPRCRRGWSWRPTRRKSAARARPRSS